MRIAILTNFAKSRVYGVYEATISEAACLAYPGNEVDLFVLEGYEQTQPLPGNFPVRFCPEIPVPPKLLDYDTYELRPEHIDYATKLGQFLFHRLKDYELVITHDWVFTGWNLPFFHALERICDDTRETAFMHWIHSTPGVHRPWWQLERLGIPNHRLVFPNRSDRSRVANFYRTDLDKVLYIPHVVDIRHLFNFQPETLAFLDAHPDIFGCKIIQVYPAGADRLEAKGVRELVLLFAALKRRGFPVMLILACHNAESQRARDDIQGLKNLAAHNGLEPGLDLLFTSEEGFPNGVPKRALVDLLQFSTVFIYPTRQETFGLVLPEVVLASGALPVINLSLDVVIETAGYNGLLTHFGSVYLDFNVTDEAKWIDSIAGQIIGQLRSEEGIKTRNFFLRRYNMHAVYMRDYAPAIEHLLAEMPKC
jgi:hypothetical protein